MSNYPDRWGQMLEQGAREYPNERVVAFLNRIIANNPGIVERGTGLDLGCGGGRHTRLMADHGIRTTAVDESYVAVELAEERYAQMENTEDFVLGNEESPELANDYEIIVAWGVFTDSTKEKLKRNYSLFGISSLRMDGSLLTSGLKTTGSMD